jgi:Flp pilus assembly protein TadG
MTPRAKSRPPMIRPRLNSFAACARGVAAVEFALIAPTLVLAYFGLAELTEGLMASRKISTVASTLGDLTAQAASTTPGQVSDIFSIGQTLMKPFPTGGQVLTMRLSSVTVDANGVPRIDWSEGQGMGALAKGSSVALPLATKAQPGDPSTPFIASGQSVIMAEAHYQFASPLKQYLPATSDLHDVLYMAPRQGTTVTCSSC